MMGMFADSTLLRLGCAKLIAEDFQVLTAKVIGLRLGPINRNWRALQSPSALPEFSPDRPFRPETREHIVFIGETGILLTFRYLLTTKCE